MAALQFTLAAGAERLTIKNLIGVATTYICESRYPEALPLVLLAQAHPKSQRAERQQAAGLFTQIAAQMPAATVAAAQAAAPSAGSGRARRPAMSPQRCVSNADHGLSRAFRRDARYRRIKSTT